VIFARKIYFYSIIKKCVRDMFARPTWRWTAWRYLTRRTSLRQL